MAKNLRIKIILLIVGSAVVMGGLFAEYLSIIKSPDVSPVTVDYATVILALSAIAVLVASTMITINVMLSHQKGLILNNERLKAVTENIPGGVVCCMNNPKFKVRFVSDGFVEMTGYTKEDIDLKFDGEFFKMVFPSDRKVLEAKLRESTDGYSVFQYRMIKSNGATIWLLDKGNLVGKGKQDSLYYRVLTDITDLKLTEQALMKSKAELNLVNERYRIVLDQSNYIIFDLDLVTANVAYSSNFEKKFGVAPSTKNFPQCFVDDEMVHRDDIKRFLSFFEKIKDGASEKEEEIRLKSKNGGYSWFNICVSTISGENNTVIRAIGRMADITRQRSDSARILTKNQIDEKTGLMNMNTAFEYIKNTIDNDKTLPGALMLIGISPESDEVVPEFASRLRDLFRSTDILGYTDENKFIVFMRNCNRQLVERRSNEILSVIDEFGGEKSRYCGNIGVSLFPKDAENSPDLYKKAQLALIHSENKKRAWYSVYDEI